MIRHRSETLGSSGAKLVVGGLGAAIPICAVVVGIIWAAVSGLAALSCAIGALTGIVAMAVSQVILTSASKMNSMTTLAVAVGAYAVGIAGTIIALAMLSKHTTLTLFWVGMGIPAAGFSYTLGLALTYPRLRIPLYGGEEPGEKVQNLDEIS